jgi:hypothetical protein
MMLQEELLRISILYKFDFVMNLLFNEKNVSVELIEKISFNEDVTQDVK